MTIPREEGSEDNPIKWTSVTEWGTKPPGLTDEVWINGLLLNINEAMPSYLKSIIAKAADLNTILGKQALAKTINAECRRCGQVLAHPETGDPCILLAINDKWGGKFALENRKTKKRSHTTRSADEIPLRTIPIPPENQS